MLLVHGTSEEVARLVVTEGLKPRTVTGSTSHWEIESRNDLVYLTTAYAGYFAYHSALSAGDPDEQFDTPWGFIQVDTSKLDKSKLVPDEDWLEQATRTQEGPWPSWDRDANSGESNMVDRTNWFRARLEDFQHLWPQSIKGLGNCAYKGNIPPEAIQVIATFRPSSNMTMTMMACDPFISLMNYAIASDKYQGLSRWFLGQKVAPEELDPSLARQLTSLPESFPKDVPENLKGIAHILERAQQRKKFLASEIEKRDGLTYLKHFLDGDPNDFPQRELAMTTYRETWEEYRSAPPPRRHLLQEKMDQLQLKIAVGPGPLWQSFADSLPGFREHWAGQVSGFSKAARQKRVSKKRQQKRRRR